jgi:hypothetical protein
LRHRSYIGTQQKAAIEQQNEDMIMTDLTISEALKDPLIRLLLQADKVNADEFAQLLEQAARRRSQQLLSRTQIERQHAA